VANLEKSAARMPILPLPYGILFPHATLPLRIVEPHYMKLISRIVEGNHFLAIASFKDGWAEGEKEIPEIHELVGLGYIGRTSMTQEGHLLIFVKGLVRARIKQELRQYPFRFGELQLLFDRSQVVAWEALKVCGQQLWSLYDKVLDYLPDHGEEIKPLIHKDLAPWVLCDLVSAHLIHNYDMRSKIFRIVDPQERCNFVINLLQEYLEYAVFLRGGKKETPKYPWLN
jgi:Lon protease-like protein